MSDSIKEGSASDTRRRRWSALTETNFDAKRKELGVADELKETPGVTTLMLVAFGEKASNQSKTSRVVRLMIFTVGWRNVRRSYETQRILHRFGSPVMNVTR